MEGVEDGLKYRGLRRCTNIFRLTLLRRGMVFNKHNSFNSVFDRAAFQKYILFNFVAAWGIVIYKQNGVYILVEVSFFNNKQILSLLSPVL